MLILYILSLYLLLSVNYLLYAFVLCYICNFVVVKYNIRYKVVLYPYYGFLLMKIAISLVNNYLNKFYFYKLLTNYELKLRKYIRYKYDVYIINKRIKKILSSKTICHTMS